MSSIPPNIIGSIFQAQVSSTQNAKEADAQRNKRLRDARELARLADQQTHEVEDADHAENLRVHREDERPRNGQDARDTYEQHRQSRPAQSYSPEGKPTSGSSDEPDQEPPGDHIDLSV